MIEIVIKRLVLAPFPPLAVSLVISQGQSPAFVTSEIGLFLFHRLLWGKNEAVHVETL